MSSNASGCAVGQRQAAPKIMHTYPFQFNTTGIGSSILVDTIHASVDKPVQLEVSLMVTTTFNPGTAGTLGIGTTSGANELINSSTLSGGYQPASNAVIRQRITADTPIWVKFTQTGTPATTGSAIAIIGEYQENSKPIA